MSPEPDREAVVNLIMAARDRGEGEILAAFDNLSNVISGVVALETLVRLTLPYLRVAIESPEGAPIEATGFVVEWLDGTPVDAATEAQVASLRLASLVSMLSSGDCKSGMEFVESVLEEDEAGFGDMIVAATHLYAAAYGGYLAASRRTSRD